MTTFQIGRQAEAKAAEYLQAEGFKVLDQNWRTRYCEIDIVAQKGQAVYFVEVKYRASDTFGSGAEYVLPKKLQQMTFAAEFWVQEHDWTGDYQLAVLEVSGPDFAVTNFLTDL